MLEPDYRKQISTVILFHVLLFGFLFSVSSLFWSLNCGEGWKSCVGDGFDGPLWYLLFASIRPLIATPNFVLAIIGGDAYDLS